MAPRISVKKSALELLQSIIALMELKLLCRKKKYYCDLFICQQQHIQSRKHRQELYCSYSTARLLWSLKIKRQQGLLYL